MTDIPALIERLRNPMWVHPAEHPTLCTEDTVRDMGEAAAELSRLTVSSLPEEIARFVAMIQSDSMDLRHKHVREEIAATLQRLAQEVERREHQQQSMAQIIVKLTLERNQRSARIAELEAAAKAPLPQNIARLVNWCEVNRDREAQHALKVSGAGEAAEIYGNLAAALSALAQEVERLKTFHPIKEG